MAKKGMRRPGDNEMYHQKKNDGSKQVPEIQGKAKSGHHEANDIKGGH